MHLPPATLIEHPDNARIYGDDADSELIESIRIKGVLTPLLVTRSNVIISGHRRWKAAMTLGLSSVPIAYFESDDELDVLEALIEANRQRVKTNEQIGREFQELKRIEAERARIRQLAELKKGTELPVLMNSSEREVQGNARDIAAAKIGIKGVQGEKITKVLDHIDTLRDQGFEEDADELRKTLNKSAHAAYQAIRRNGLHEELKRVENANTTLPVEKRKYRIIYADPPWPYETIQIDYGSSIVDHYPTMSLDDIKQLPIRDLALEDAVLFMWGIVPKLPEALEVIKAWGFTYKTHFVWDKVKHNMGHYSSVRHEMLFVCTRGRGTPDVQKLFDSVYVEERTQHSRKPDYFRTMIDTLYPIGPRIELFARGKAAEGWEHYGNQAVTVPG